MNDDLLKKAQDGDDKAYSAIVLEYQSAIRGYLARRIPDHDEVFDVAQEVFLGAYRNLKQFDPSRDFGAWLRGIARHAAIDYLRKRTKRSAREIGEVESVIAAQHVLSAETENESVIEDRLSSMRECVKKLKDAHAEAYQVMDMRYFQDMPAVRIGQTTGKNEGAIRILLMRVRRSLKECMEKARHGREAANA
jgi:RNA polymerase sigma-70 factor, ECF subfamily